MNIQLCIGVLFLGLGLHAFALNLLLLLKRDLRGSPIPFAGGFLIGLGLWLVHPQLPWPAYALPTIFDPGGVPSLLWQTAVAYRRGAFQKPFE